MKNTFFYILLLLFPLVFFSCEQEDPTMLTFSELYGRDDWEIVDDSGLPEGLFAVKKSNDISVSESGSAETGYSYTISTTGSQPHFTTQRITAAMNPARKVLSFMYKSSAAIEASISLDIYKSDAFTKVYAIPAASDWTNYTFDLDALIAKVGWGGIGSYFRIYLGDQQGVNVEIKEMQVRERTPEEEAAASAYFIQFNVAGNKNQIDELVDITEVTTYNGFAYKYVASVGSNDPWAWTYPRSRAIAADETKLSFQYISEVAGNLQLFFVIRGGGQTPGFAFDPASEWTEVTFDLSGVIPGILGKHADALDSGHPMRLDINGTGGTPFYIRALRLHK